MKENVFGQIPHHYPSHDHPISLLQILLFGIYPLKILSGEKVFTKLLLLREKCIDIRVKKIPGSITSDLTRLPTEIFRRWERRTGNIPLSCKPYNIVHYMCVNKAKYDHTSESD